MARNTKINVFYRMAEKQNKYNREKPEYINNLTCLRNFVKRFKEADITVYGDRLEESTIREIENMGVGFVSTKTHGNAQTFVETLNKAMELDGDDFVYFVEDDYIHTADAHKILSEGLNKFDYVSLYDHSDKYNGTPVILTYTKSTHWQLANSTTMTFAGQVKKIEQDIEVFYKYTLGDHPHDYFLWTELLQNNRTLGTPIPGRSTHGITQFLSPTLKWKEQL